MGISLFSSATPKKDCCGCQPKTIYITTPPPPPPKLPNPDPHRFKLLQSAQVGNYLIVMIHYLDCTNYEGKKILLYENCTLADFKKHTHVDPHFSEDQFSPIARFVPTREGWVSALILAKALHRIHVKQACMIKRAAFNDLIDSSVEYIISLINAKGIETDIPFSNYVHELLYDNLEAKLNPDYLETENDRTVQG